jgi:hypothetical protein
MIAVEHYDSRHVSNPDPRGKISDLSFHKVCNAIVNACQKHGPTGPMGLFPIGSGLDFFKALDKWASSGSPNPTHFVADDQYNDERYRYIECNNPTFLRSNGFET